MKIMSKYQNDKYTLFLKVLFMVFIRYALRKPFSNHSKC